ncbi:YbaK/EbsC family protein [Haloarcula nitratireducens]|uniref:YbaK/EbsC family protein n=1 Tax=Haloarcula nitratireducens TaxID=2487749 RepID=A0AAW4PI91_9EURY|nr:YbaK/EbsC family protein [Halomicroarcula nitratireducens]MBX0297221.1 YbaK/EbsC family protein [Halomicroarcula nitratireducens]
MHPSAERFVDRAREQYGIEIDAHEFPEGTKTAADAADAVGCELAQIASSIVLSVDDDLVVVVTSGANRVSESKVAAHFGVPEGPVSMADAGRVKNRIGWSIGGVPPFCHDTAVPVLFDETLTEFDTVWAAAGTPKAVFPIAPSRVRELSEAAVLDVAE